MIKGYSQNKTVQKAYAGDLPDLKPTLTLSTKDLKDIKNWKVGDTYDLCITVKQKSMQHQNSDGSMDASFEVQDVTVDDEADDGTDDN